MNAQNIEREFLGQRTHSTYNTIMGTYVQTHRMYTSRVNSNVRYGLHVIMVCQYRFISYNKYTDVHLPKQETLVMREIIVEEAAHGGSLYPSFNFIMNLKLLL